MGAAMILDAHGYPMRHAEPPYTGASRTHQDLALYRPRNVSAQTAVSTDRELLAARIHDQARNDGWADAATQRKVDNVIGAGWRLVARPNAKALGIAEEQANDLADQMEAAWDEYCNDIDHNNDVGQQFSVGMQQALLFRHFCWDGESLGAMYYLERGGPFATAMSIIDPDRLSTPMGVLETTSLRDGIELGPNGERVAYYIRVDHPGDDVANRTSPIARWQRVERSTAWGRRNIIHHFEPERAGQLRGVSKLASVVKKLRMVTRYDEAELQAAVMNAVLAAFVTSPMDHDDLANAMSDEVRNYQDGRLDYWKESGINLTGAKATFMYPGEDVKFSEAVRPAAGHEAFIRTALRNIATVAGISYEQLSMDWGQVNYSSARAALLEIYRNMTARAGHFAAGVIQPWYCNVMEEAFAKGKVVALAGWKAFQEAKGAYCRAKWIGPARGWIDPLKEADAAAARMEAGISTLERECADQGEYWQDVIRQRAREQAFAKEMGIELQPGAVAARGRRSNNYPDNQDKAA